MTSVLLIRHGESLSNAGFATSTTNDVLLTSNGYQQAQHIASKLKIHSPPDLIITSSYERTKRTARPTISAFPSVPVEVWPVHEFSYLSLSAWRKDRSTVDDRRSMVETYWEIADPTWIDGPGAESFEQFIQRVRNVKIALRATGLEKIVVFSHEQFISALSWLTFKQDRVEMSSETMKRFREYLKANPLPNGEMRCLRMRNRSITVPLKESAQLREQDLVGVK